MDSAAAVTPPHVARPLVLHPFPGMRLAASRIGDPAAARTFARPYRNVAARLATWQQRGLLTRDVEPALYLHEYAADGRTIRGLVGALDVSRRALQPEDRAVLPHEAVYPAQADDLASRMELMRLDPAPILLVQRSPQPLRAALARVRERLPLHQFVDRRGEAHRLWVIRDAREIEEISRQLSATVALIADGHHRYAAYLRRHQRDASPAAAAGIAMLVDQDDTPLALNAIHRVLVGTALDDLVGAARLLGLPVSRLSAAPVDPEPGPARLRATDGTVWWDIELPPGPRSAVEILHDDLVPAVAYGPTRIGYHHRAETAVAQAGARTGPAVLLAAPSLDRVIDLARTDRLLPEKATSFQPKPPVGVLMRSLDSPDAPR